MKHEYTRLKVLKMNELTAVTFSQAVQYKAIKDDSTLLEAMAVVCEENGVSCEEVTKYEQNGAKTNLITSQLKDKLEAECIDRGMIIGRSKSVSALDFL